MEQPIIIEPSVSVDFSNAVYLGAPSKMSIGVYFTPLFLNKKAVVIQTPSCMTKQGIKSAGKRNYTDLVFSEQDEFFINWIDQLQNEVQRVLLTMDWFEKKLEEDDVESMFMSMFKPYKSGKKYLFRTDVKSNIPIYDQHVNKGQLVEMNDVIAEKTNMICILEIQGIRFTSQSFAFKTEIKQIAIVSPDPYMDACFIKVPTKAYEETANVVVPVPAKGDYTCDLNDAEEKESSPSSFPPVSIPPMDETNNAATNNSNMLLSADDIQEIRDNLNVSFDPTVNVRPVPKGRKRTSKKDDNNDGDGEGDDMDDDVEPIKIVDESDNENGNEQGNILLDFEDVVESGEKEVADRMDDEVELRIDEDDGEMILNQPTDIYGKMYSEALMRAQEAEKEARRLFNEAEEIKKNALKYNIQL